MRKVLKLIFSLILVLGLTFSLVACGSKDDGGNNQNNGGNGQSGEGEGGGSQGGSGQSGEGEGGQGGGAEEDTLKVDVKASEAGLTNMLGSGKLYVTTFGQADKAYLKEMIDEVTGNGETKAYTYDDQLKASDVEAGSLVIAVVGYTSKGIAKEITQTGEVQRAQAFAAKEGINLVIVQLSGKARRGDSSDPIIAAATPGAKLTLIFDNGNKTDKATGADFDGKYSTVWCKDKALFAFSDEWDMTEYFKVILGL